MNNARTASKTSNAREVNITHLALRSPMFGETCISKSMSEFKKKTKKRRISLEVSSKMECARFRFLS